jgi:hypothetical protein
MNHLDGVEDCQVVDGRSTVHVRKCCDRNSLERSCVGGLLGLVRAISHFKNDWKTQNRRDCLDWP